MFFSGWLHEQEDRSLYHGFSSPVAKLYSFGGGELRVVADPESEFVIDDPDGTLQVEDQQQTNSCVGHGGTSAMERCYYLATGGKMRQLSRWFAYVESQKIAGIRGDSGSTISAMANLANKSGVCREEYCKFTGKYYTTVPAEAYEDAANFRLGSVTPIGSVDQDMIFLGKNIGALCCGFQWTSSFEQPIIETFRPGRGGGHCVCIPFLSPRTDSAGRNYAWLLNSWSTRWGQRGWKEISPAARQALYRHQWTEVIGFSDMIDPRPRTIAPLTVLR